MHFTRFCPFCSGSCRDVLVKMRDLGRGPIAPFLGEIPYGEHNLRKGHGPDDSWWVCLDLSGGF